jgi:rhodanese-related sulfurtransferase
MRTRVPVAAAALALTGALALSACSSSEPTATADAPAEQAGAVPVGEPAARVAREQGRTVIDVRTPEEFAAGHIAGATNLNLQDPGFAAAVAALDPAERYVVYCRSGNRSAAAAAQMRAVGLDVLDGGGLQTMAAAGWPSA